MEINNLIIEVTRKCQLECIHCLRGKSQSKVLSREALENLLADVTRISTVTFTGGEPFLYPRVIKSFVEICEKNEIGVGSFYIATNGIIFSEKSKLSSRGLSAIIDLYNLCSENEYSMIKVSKDQYHYTDDDAGMLLKAFSFVSFDDSDGYIIIEGNAIDNFDPSSNKTKNQM